MTLKITKKGEFQVNTGGTLNHQRNSDVATLENGNTVAVWMTQNTGSSATGGDGNGFSVKAKIVNAAGNQVKSEIQVNTNETGNQFAPTVKALSDGGFMVAWTDASGAGPDSADDSVRAQRYDSAGNKVGVEFLVNTGDSTGDQRVSDVVEVGTNIFIFSFQSNGAPGGDGEDVRMVLFTPPAPGAPFGEVTANINLPGNQTSPQIAASNNGNVMAVWTTSANNDGDGSGIKGRVYSQILGTVKTEFLINVNETTGNQTNPRIAALKNGNFAVAWTTDDTSVDGDTTALHMRIYDNTGTALTNETRVNNVGAGTQNDMSITALNDGRFLIVWEGGDSSQEGIKGRVFNADGTAYGKEFLVNAKQAGRQLDPEVTTLKNGKVMVTWTTNDASQDGDLDGIQGRVLDVGSVRDGNGGKNKITGDAGRDEINGKGGNDTIKGLGGNDVLKGGGGKDKIFVGKGVDKAIGGAGKDQFVFAKKDGKKNTVNDFDNGQDKLNLKAFGYTNKTQALAEFTDAGGANNNKVIFNDKGTKIVIKGIDLDQLGASDILI